MNIIHIDQNRCCEGVIFGSYLKKFTILNDFIDKKKYHVTHGNVFSAIHNKELVERLINDCIIKMTLELETDDINMLEMYYTEIFDVIREYSKKLDIEKYKEI